MRRLDEDEDGGHGGIEMSRLDDGEDLEPSASFRADRKSRSPFMAPPGAETASASVRHATPKWIKVVAICGAALLVLIVLIVASVALSKSSSSSGPQSPLDACEFGETVYQLTPSITPVNYVLSMRTNVVKDFSGNVSITTKFSKASSCVVLNAEGLTIQSASVKLASSNTQLIPQISFNETRGQVFLLLSQTIPAGTHEVTLSFSGLLRDDMSGFYRSTFRNELGQLEYLAATQFEPISARRAFPCFDMIGMKATFEISLGAVDPDGKYSYLSNMPATGAPTLSPDGSIRTYRFQKTPIMSSYLIAFIVGRLQSRTVTKKIFNDQDVKFSVWSVPPDFPKTEFALDVSWKCTDALGRFLGYSYRSMGLPKMDLVAVPDFAAGAMENWGLLTFRDRALLVDRTTASPRELDYVANVICHEIAHQWFGDLVTPIWWKHLWLKEGFATYFSFLGENEVFPEWKVFESFLVDEVAPALYDNSLPSARSHIIDIATLAEIDNLYDSITYNRGGAMLRMLRAYLSSKTRNENMFATALNSYLLKYQFSNVETDNLFDAMGEASGISTLRQQMSSWMDIPGYPYINITRKGSQYELSQSRFLIVPPENMDSQSSNVWWIPIDIKMSNGETRLVEMNTKSMTLPSEISTPWFLGNAGAQGFYRVNYPNDMYNVFIEKMRDQIVEFSVFDRFALVDDIFAFARAGIRDAVLALRFFESLSYSETSFPVWASAIGSMLSIRNIISLQSYAMAFDQFAARVLNASVFRLGFEKMVGESFEQYRLRPVVLGASAMFGNQFVISESIRRYKLFESNETLYPIDASIRSVVYTTFVREGGLAEYSSMYARFISATSANERLRCLAALASTRNRDLIIRTLNFVFDRTLVRLQDVRSLVFGITSNPYGRDIAWNFFRVNWNWFNRNFGSGREISRYVFYLTSSFSTNADRMDVSSFFTSHVSAGQGPGLSEAIASIRANIFFLEKSSGRLNEFLGPYLPSL